MSIFINPSATIPVTDGQNTIHVRSRIDFQTYAKIEESLMKLEMTTSKASQNGTAKDGDDGVTIGARYTRSGQSLAVLQECVMGWEGPLFSDARGQPVPCTRKAIAMLDPNHPLVKKVLEELDQRNAQPTELAQAGEGDTDPNPPDQNS